jgi:hypothetical protein
MLLSFYNGQMTHHLHIGYHINFCETNPGVGLKY